MSPRLNDTNAFAHPDSLACLVKTNSAECFGANVRSTATKMMKRMICRTPATSSNQGMRNQVYMFIKPSTNSSAKIIKVTCHG